MPRCCSGNQFSRSDGFPAVTSETDGCPSSPRRIRPVADRRFLSVASALLLSGRRLRRRRNLRRTLRSTLRSRCWRRFHILQFDVKNQGRVRTDVRTHCALAIREGRGNEQLILCSLLHQLKRFRPAFDHSVDRKGRGLTALVRTVKFRPIDQSAR